MISNKLQRVSANKKDPTNTSLLSSLEKSCLSPEDVTIPLRDGPQVIN